MRKLLLLLPLCLVRQVAGAGQDIRLDYDRKSDTSARVDTLRNFANKLWNVTRFALMNLGGETSANLGEPDLAALQLADRWILSRLARVNRDSAERYGSYGLGEAAKGLYEFAWNEVCDWCVELIKRCLNPGENPSAETLADQRTACQVLAKALNELLVMLHPLMPHLSEELWHGLNGEPEETFLAPPPLRPIPAAKALAGVSGELQVLLPIDGLVDLDVLWGRLEKDTAKVQMEIKGLSARLFNPNFASKAPPEVVVECQANLAEAEAQAELARKLLNGLLN